MEWFWARGSALAAGEEFHHHQRPQQGNPVILTVPVMLQTGSYAHLILGGKQRDLITLISLYHPLPASAAQA